MRELQQPSEMLAWSREARASGRQIGFVPTMGYLHEGHLRLMDLAVEAADVVVSSIFVNPIQFGPKEDLGSYPRDLERDRSLAAQRHVDCLFVPPAEAMYPSTPLVCPTPGGLADHLCGARRPGHFQGVLTVVAKLFNIVEPDLAVFGRKDIQQALLIKRMVEDMSFPVKVLVAPTVREHDGVAMSSRNSYLSLEERAVAPLLSKGLEEAHKAFLAGVDRSEDLERLVRSAVSESPLIRLDYVEVVDPDTISPVQVGTDDSIVAVAALLGKARLIDNIILGRGVGSDERIHE